MHMVNKQRNSYGHHGSKEKQGEVQSEPHGFGSGSVAEPMTPPASAHPGSVYSNQHYSHSSSFSSKPQFSPKLSVREQALPAYGFGAANSGPLASPIDTPLFTPLNSQQPSYLATPHTPLPTSTAENSTTTTTPSTSRPLSMSSARHVASSGASSSMQGITPLGHTRSYSYNLRDRQNAMGRLSVSSTSSSSSVQEREPRPRAYSSGIAAAPVPFAGSLNPATVGQTSLEMSAAHYPFPPPLSSPVSPENLIAINGRIATRPQFAHSFTTTTYDDQVSANQGVPAPGPKSGLHRSLSAISSFNGFGGNTYLGHFAPHGNQYEDLGDSTSSFSSNNTSPNGPTGRRTSPPSTRSHRQRRSSSGASSSSMLDITVHAGSAASNLGGNAGVPTSALNSPAGKGLPHMVIDTANADDQQIYSLCKDQRGCRFLQRKLSEGDPQVISRVFDATKAHIVSLMVDPFGNYLCQKLLEYCSADEITELLTVASASLPTIAVNQHGTRALQKLIDAVSKPEQVGILVNSLNGHVVRLIRDLNGNHVIQKLLLDLDSNGSQFIYDAVCQSVIEIGSHRHGCCVLQRCLDYAQDYNRNNLVSHIVAKAPVLVCDPFGNYVCQYVIDLGVQRYTDSLVLQLLGQISTLSVQKFSSNVVEKCLRSASPDLQRKLISEIMVPKTLHELLLDNYGNYVIQTALESSSSLDATAKQQLAESIQHALLTTRSPYGRRVMSKLKSW